MSDPPINKKQHIESYIKEKLSTEPPANLKAIKNHFLVENKFAKLSYVDDAFIEETFVKECSDLFIKQAEDFLTEELKKNNAISFVQKVFSLISSAKNIEDIKSPFDNLIFYKLLIVDNRKIINDSEVKELLNRFKKLVLQKIISYSDNVEQELNFLDAITEFISTSIVAVKLLPLNEFCNSDLKFQDFLKSILDLNENLSDSDKWKVIDQDVYTEKFKKLKETTKLLIGNAEIIFLDTFKRIFKSYVEETKIEFKSIDGRSVLEVSGKFILVKETSANIERKFREKSVEEVRFVGSDILYVDGDFKKEIWHGKNLVVYSKAVLVCSESTWDVSGLDNKNQYSKDAGTGRDGSGIEGKDGIAGESGGNVLFITDRIIKGEKFRVISNGGDGSKGQDGGNGNKGSDGQSINKAKLDSEFPSPVKALYWKWERPKLVEHVVNNIRKIGTLRTNYSSSQGDRFVKASTNNGGAITFSYYTPNLFTHYQDYFLYEGAPGSRGKEGGEPGRGGEGGYSGEIIINDRSVIVSKRPGKSGANGLGGFYGAAGKSGWDIGYIDHQLWGSPKYYGTSYDKKISLSYGGENSPTRIWCYYMDKYCELVPRQNINTNISFKVRKTINQERKLQRQAEATKKKTITKTSISSQYSHLFNNSAEKLELDQLKLKLKNQKSEAIDIYTEAKEEIKINTEIRIERQNKRPNLNRYQNIPKLLLCAGAFEYNFDVWFEEIKYKGASKEFWLNLNSFQITFPQICSAYSEFKMSQFSNEIEIENLFKQKLIYSVLNEISPSIKPDFEEFNIADLLPESASKFLIETPKNKSSKLVDVLNNFEAQKSNIKLDNSVNNNLLLKIIGLYIIEVGSSSTNETIKKHYTDYLKFYEERKKIISNFRDVLINVLKTSSANLDDLEISIRSDPFLFKVYNRYKSELSVNFNWSECVNNSAIIDACQKHMIEKGCSAPCTREFLAGSLDFNLRLYGETDSEKNLQLMNNHNEDSKTIVYVLWKEDEFVSLEIDEKYLKLTENRLNFDNLYSKILVNVKNLNNLDQFNEFIKNPLKSNKAGIDFNSYPKVFREDEFIDGILSLFEEADAKILKKPLEAIRGENIGNSEILRQIHKKLITDGVHLEVQLLRLLINCIIISNIESRNENHIYLWMIESEFQENWIKQLLKMQLENHFKSQLDEFSFENFANKEVLLLFCIKFMDNPLQIDEVRNIFKLLNAVVGDLPNLEEFDLTEWQFALKSRYWIEKLKYFAHLSSEELEEISQRLLSLENTYNSRTIEKFITFLIDNKIQLETEQDTALFIDILIRFQREDPRLSEKLLKETSSSNITAWNSKLIKKYPDQDRQRDVHELAESIIEDPNTSKSVAEIAEKAKEIILNMNNLRCSKLNNKRLLDFSEADIKIWVKRKYFSNDKPDEILTVIYRSVELKHNAILRETQKYAILLFLLGSQNTLCQMATGEGKSLVIVSLAIFKALKNEKVDVITSSSVLAKRDAENYADVFELFGISVAHNCSEDMEERKNAYSNNQVVYGDLSNFQRDYLLDKFYSKNILGDRSFTNLILDEVDSMLLDKGNNILYLSQDLVGLDKLESVYLYIWQRINQPVDNIESFLDLMNVENIKKSVLFDLYGLLEKHELNHIENGIKATDIDEIWNILISNKIIDNDGLFIVDVLEFKDLQKMLSTNLLKFSGRLYFLLQQHLQRDKSINIPNYLKNFVLRHLEYWIKSAITASQIRESFEYTVDIDRSGTNRDRHAKIIILDLDTGTDLLNSQWDEGLHQFLQLKHGCRLTMQSLKSVFISNVTYFKNYTNLYGLTGTLGSHTEKDLLNKIYSVAFFTMPTAKPKKFKEDAPILCEDSEDWLKKILARAKELSKDKRPGLIITETIAEAQMIYKRFLREGYDKNVFIYDRDFEDFELIKSKGQLKGGEFIISTNLVCRGVNILIPNEVNNLGGLHVILTYLPDNSRIEIQGFGRSARKGQQGTGQLIVRNPKNQKSGGLIKMLQLKKDRDLNECERISSIRSYYQYQILSEEKCFHKFRETYQKLNEKVAKLPQEVRAILLQSCLDRWAFWLDKVQVYIKKRAEKALEDNLNQFLKELNKLTCNSDDDYKSWVNDSPILILRLANCYIKAKSYNRALGLLDDVLKAEPFFSEAAHYYKGFIYFKQNKMQQSRQQLTSCDKLLDERMNSSVSSAGFANAMKKYNERSLIQVDAFKEQKQGEMNIYNLFKKSIYDILGHPVSSQSFVTAKVDQKLALEVYEIFKKEKIFTKIKTNTDENVLKLIAKEFSFNFENLKSILSADKNFSEETIIDELKKKIPLPSREEFWDILKRDGVLNNQINYVLFNKEEFEKSMPNFKLSEPIKVDLKANEMLLYRDDNTRLIFEESTLKSEVGEENFNYLLKVGVISFNKKAELNIEKLDSLKLDTYNTIGRNDLLIEDIPAEEIDKIFNQLISKKILMKEEDSYKLIADFRKVAQMTLPEFIVYQDSIKLLIFQKSAYRIALEKLKLQILDKQKIKSIDLMPHPHSNLIFKLFEHRILEPATIIRDFDPSESNLKTIFKKHSKSLTEDTIKDLSKTIKELRTSLANFEEADCKLENLLKYFEDFTTLDTDIFILNNFDKIIELEEAKYTLKMILSSVGLLLIAVAEIAVGAAIEIFSAGTASYFGMAFIGEGISDIFYSVNAFRTGYFSWSDYGQYKLISLCVTAISFGIGGLFSKGMRFAGVAAAASWKTGVREMTKIISIRIIQGIMNAAIFVGIDIMIENCLRELCANISQSLLVNIDNAVDSAQDFMKSLKHLWEVLSYDDAKRFLARLFTDYLSKESFVEKWFPIGNQLVNSIINQISTIRNSVGNKKAKIALILATIITDVVVSSAQLLSFRAMVLNICSELSQDIDTSLKNKSKLKSPQDFDKFLNEAKYELKKMLREKSSQVIHQNVLNPVLQSGSSMLLQFVAGFIEKKYDSFRDSKIMREFEKQREEYYKRFEDNTSEIVEVDQSLTRTYHMKILELSAKLKAKTKKEKLFNELIKVEKPDTQLDKRITDKLDKRVDKLKKEASTTGSKLNKTLTTIENMLNRIENEELKTHLKKCFNSEESHYKFKLDDLSERDRKAVLSLRKLVKEDFNDPKNYFAIKHKLQAEFDEIRQDILAYDEISAINKGDLSLKFESRANLIPEIVLTLRYLKDDIFNDPDSYLSSKRLNTIAANIEGDVLYLACNYHIEIENSDTIKNAGWSSDSNWLAEKLKNYCHAIGVKKIVFLEPETRAVTRSGNRAPHAEMQLLSYAKFHGLKFEGVDISKAPCVSCLKVLKQNSVRYLQVPGSNLGPKNWNDPRDIRVREVAVHDFSKDFGRFPPWVSKFDFERAKIVCSWLTVDEARVLPKKKRGKKFWEE